MDAHSGKRVASASRAPTPTSPAYTCPGGEATRPNPSSLLSWASAQRHPSCLSRTSPHPSFRTEQADFFFRFRSCSVAAHASPVISNGAGRLPQAAHASPVISNGAGRFFLPLSLLRKRRPAQREISLLFGHRVGSLGT